ncbi:MAG TPA: iron-sulfur cluster assembly scaffold protein [Acidobacteriota bacterium]|nr:iron-sulfur cluster assembly scaffold protein [Acidobacteriota bacterium]
MSNYDMYKEQILDLYKHPLNKGSIAHHTHQAHKENPSCGDGFTIQFLVKDGIIVDAKFAGSGCAISTAGASLITEKVKGMSIHTALGISSDEMLALLGIPVSAARLKCALLALEITQDALTPSSTSPKVSQ